MTTPINQNHLGIFLVIAGLLGNILLIFGVIPTSESIADLSFIALVPVGIMLTKIHKEQMESWKNAPASLEKIEVTKIAGLEDTAILLKQFYEDKTPGKVPGLKETILQSTGKEFSEETILFNMRMAAAHADMNFNMGIFDLGPFVSTRANGSIYRFTLKALGLDDLLKPFVWETLSFAEWQMRFNRPLRPWELDAITQKEVYLGEFDLQD